MWVNHVGVLEDSQGITVEKPCRGFRGLTGHYMWVSHVEALEDSQGITCGYPM